MAFEFLKRTNLAEAALDLKLAHYTPTLVLEGLMPGVDNVRHDVHLSHKFCEAARAYIAKSIARHGNVEDLIADINSSSRAHHAKQSEPPDFKTLLSDLLISALNRAKNEQNISLDLLAHVAVIKYLRAELATQYADVLERCRTKLRSFEGPRQPNPAKAMEIRERFSRFQTGKRGIFRKCGGELLQALRDVDKESLSRMRRSFFGENSSGVYELFLNRLVFTEGGRDDETNAENYVMIGNYQKDVDRLDNLLRIATAFLDELNYKAMSDPDATPESIISEPENAQVLMAGGSPDPAAPEAKAQRTVLAAWVDVLERETVLDCAVAAYECVPLLSEYLPHVNPQQLKNALLDDAAFDQVEGLIEAHGTLSVDNLYAARDRVQRSRGAERAKVAGRFLFDFMRFYRDLRRLEALNSAADGVHLLGTEKLRELSSINNTLYEFVLPEEGGESAERVISHVILKADVRGSTSLTEMLVERGLNPASYFSLNFFEPVNKLLPIFGAEKVFLEGDALILALFENEGGPRVAVSRACVLARDIQQIVGAYNEQSARSGLPPLELGIGICYQEGAPMYLVDGDNRIMISPALNASDRLSSSSKKSHKLMKEATLYNVVTFRLDDPSAEGDENLIRYNVGGICLSADAFSKLATEIALTPHRQVFRTALQDEKAELVSGVVPLPTGGFRTIAVRTARMPRVNAEGDVNGWGDERYYEVCTHPAIYDRIEGKSATAAAAR
jgi:class 3 adenylate cyclase